MDARDEVLANIRRALGVTGREATRRLEVETRLAQRPRGVIPARGQLEAEDRRALFRDMALAAQASVVEVAAMEDVPAAVSDFLRGQNLPPRLRRGADARLAALPWDGTVIAALAGASDGSDEIGLSHAEAGVAETGTLVLASGPDNPTTLNFLPDTHVVVVRAADIHGDYESMWDALRARPGDVTPRAVNWVTGPSRSADIEQTLLLGAHGPRRLHILLVA